MLEEKHNEVYKPHYFRISTCPSICKKGNDFYLVTSSFEYFPGLPVFHSTDLVNWKQVGHCLTRKSQLNLENAQPSEGIYAPTIRYNSHDDLFYMVTTNVSNIENFYVYAKDPSGEWSEPILVKQGGIDPSLFFDDEGVAHFISNARVEYVEKAGFRMAPIDLKTGKLLKATTVVCSVLHLCRHGNNHRSYATLDDKKVKLMLEHLINISEPWLQYAIRVNLLNESKDKLSGLRNEALKDKKIQAYLKDITDFNSILVSNHKNPELPFHKLLFLLDIGFDTNIPEIDNAIKQIMSHKDKYGVYQSKTNIPKHYGGKGEDVFGWCLCDAPLLLLALLRGKVDYQQHIKPGVDYLITLNTEQGFPCSVSVEHGKFRGPGRKDDCCPYATLSMLNLLSGIDEYRDSNIVKNGVEVILSLWEHSLDRHPYMFYMGTDFRKLKAPALWYDILSVADCLSKFEYSRTDIRFLEMISIIKGKQDKDGMFTPESVYQKCKGWDFAQKKNVSPYLSYLCVKLFNRL